MRWAGKGQARSKERVPWKSTLEEPNVSLWSGDASWWRGHLSRAFQDAWEFKQVMKKEAADSAMCSVRQGNERGCCGGAGTSGRCLEKSGWQEAGHEGLFRSNRSSGATFNIWKPRQTTFMKQT